MLLYYLILLFLVCVLAESFSMTFTQPNGKKYDVCVSSINMKFNNNLLAGQQDKLIVRGIHNTNDDIILLKNISDGIIIFQNPNMSQSIFNSVEMLTNQNVQLLLICLPDDNLMLDDTKKNILPSALLYSSTCRNFKVNDVTQPYLSISPFWKLVSFFPLFFLAVLTFSFAGHLGALLTIERSDENEDTSLINESPTLLSKCCWIVWVCFALGFMVLNLLLIFFFYDIFVYIIITFFVLYSAASTNYILSWFFGYLYKCYFLRDMKIVPFVFCKKSFKIRLMRIILLPLCLTFSLVWLVYRNAKFSWILLDILGFFVCCNIICKFRLMNLRYISIFLWFLFFYDIFMVFVTPHIGFLSRTQSSKRHIRSVSEESLFSQRLPSRVGVMESVALGVGGKSGEMLPLLFKMPDLFDVPGAICFGGESMLGFGDIIVPGILLVFCHTLDLLRKGSRWLYYIALIIAYIFSLFVTLIANSMMKKAQPALLYIVPFLWFTFIFVALVRRELKLAWNGNSVSDFSTIRQPQAPLPTTVQLSQDFKSIAEENVDESIELVPEPPFFSKSNSQD